MQATKSFLSESDGVNIDLQIAARVVDRDASRIRWFIGKGLLAECLKWGSLEASDGFK